VSPDPDICAEEDCGHEQSEHDDDGIGPCMKLTDDEFDSWPCWCDAFKSPVLLPSNNCTIEGLL